jgi:hypothetical protein
MEMVNPKLVHKTKHKIMTVKEHVLTKYCISPSKMYCLIPRRIRGGYAIIWKYTIEKQLKKKERRVVDTKTDSWVARRKVSWNETTEVKYMELYPPTIIPPLLS